MFILISLLIQVSSLEMTTSSVSVIKDNKVESYFSPDFSSEFQCHESSSVSESSKSLERKFEVTSDLNNTIITIEMSSEYDYVKLDAPNSIRINNGKKTDFDVKYSCKSDGWDRVSMKIKEGDREPILVKWQKYCGNEGGFDFGLFGLLVCAICVVGFAADRAKIVSSWQEDIEDGADVLTVYHAIGFVVVGSLFLIILFFFIKYLAIVLEVLILIFGAGSIIGVIDELNLGTKFPQTTILPYFGSTLYVAIFSALVSLCIVTIYAFTKNWILNNIIGLCFAYIMIKTVKIPSFKVGGLLLSLAFFYDIYWVFFSQYAFGANVMVSVASGLDLPIKLECPRLLSSAIPYTCSMLGLGDLALPGLFLAFASRFDHINSTSYLKVMIVCYSIALFMCVGVLVIFNHPQPALLYISPMLVFGMLGFSLYRGELGIIWKGLSVSRPLTAYEVPMEEMRNR
ncbi:hypothetical protein SteCoe_37264 [Stentor coeruleus]|uniref:Uncharacterized protein n=1 Tax=Stentor coeruleus TaxID=5963 RepID=A0A1R2AND8_9CILI|nr:hypothetical protein SteCoe_37264 [Stentor coeruleus]